MNEIGANLAYVIPVILVLYWLTSRKPLLNNVILLITGFLLYSWGHPLWGLLLFSLTLIDYLIITKFIAAGKYKKFSLILGLTVNISAWLLCKYNGVWGDWLNISFGFPLGISFYILRKIAYLLDIYNGKIKSPDRFIHYALYISYYPQILSGPIERPEAFISQIEKPRKLEWAVITKAFPLLLMGLFKKIVIADNLGMIVDRIFRLDYPSRLMLAAGSLGFTFEIYADFSGYTDLSRGFSYLLGIETSKNFNQPYTVLTPQDFWNRWHITFSNWLRDYVFFPLRRWVLKTAGGSRWLADWLTPVLTMLVSGLWHGTGWTYLVWGLYYGVLLAVYQVVGLNRLAVKNRLTKFVSWLVMFTLIIGGWMIFRAPSMDWLYQTMSTSPWGASGNQLIAFLGVITTVFLYISPLFLYFLVERSGKARDYLEPVYYALALSVLVIFAASGLQDFVYTAF